METVNIRFYKHHDGDVFAAFKDEPWNEAGDITVYEHVGQHGAASPDYVAECEVATVAESKELLAELKGRYEPDCKLVVEPDLVLKFRGEAAYPELFAQNPRLLQDLKDCMVPGGDALNNVHYVQNTWRVEADKDIRKFLECFGSWDDAELDDHNANVERVIWIVGCQIEEESFLDDDGDFYIVLDG